MIIGSDESGMDAASILVTALIIAREQPVEPGLNGTTVGRSDSLEFPFSEIMETQGSAWSEILIPNKKSTGIYFVRLIDYEYKQLS